MKDGGKTHFFNLYDTKFQRDIIKKLKRLNSKMQIVRDQSKEFQKIDLQEKWIEGKISNFDYLMSLNTYSGRTYNDINQYPVFPWILRNYTRENLGLDGGLLTDDEERRIFRRLNRPIGALSRKRREIAIEQYEDLDPVNEPHHYNSHYSAADSVANMLIRLEPFTSLNMNLHKGKLDQPCRILSSIEETWSSCYAGDSSTELTPEFFYLPKIFKNQ